MSRHARPASGRGGGWFVLLAFAILVSGAYLANAVDSTTQRPAIGLAALAAAALALVCAHSERKNRQRVEDLADVQRRDAWRFRAELDEAHARSQRALERAIAAEAAAHTLIAATESLLAVQRHAMVVAAAAQNVAPVPVSEPTPAHVTQPEPSPIFEQAAAPVLPSVPAPSPPAPPVFTPAPAPVQPAAAVAASIAEPLVPDSFTWHPTGTGLQAPAATLLDPPTTLVWPLAELPAQREPSLDLPLVRANRPRVSPLFLPVEGPDTLSAPVGSPASGDATAQPTTSAGVEPTPATQNVDLTSTVTRYARPA